MSPEIPTIEQKETPKPILLYRGIDKKSSGTAGHWWSTNPYYGFRYSEGGKGTLFVAKVQKDKLEKLASDVSIDEGFNNYFFKEDPPGARTVNQEEIEALKQHTTFTKLPIGGTIMKTPENAIEIGKLIFEK